MDNSSNSLLSDKGQDNEIKNKRWSVISPSSTELIDSLTFTVQWILDWKKNRRRSFELLSRFWNTSVLDALEILRKDNRTFDLFKKVVAEAFRLIKQWNWSESISVNVYLSDINHPHFFRYISTLQNTFNIDSSLLTFELLENNHWIIDSNTLMLLKALSVLWYKISIDDFSISNYWDNISQRTVEILLRNKVPISEVKIDWWYLRFLMNQDNWLSSNATWKKQLKNAIRYFRSIYGVPNFVWEWATPENVGFMQDVWCNLFQWLSLPSTFEIH